MCAIVLEHYRTDTTIRYDETHTTLKANTHRIFVIGTTSYTNIKIILLYRYIRIIVLFVPLCSSEYSTKSIIKHIVLFTIT